MNYYHNFTIGFNWWMLYLPLTLIVMTVVGRMANYHLTIVADPDLEGYDGINPSLLPDEFKAIKVEVDGKRLIDLAGWLLAVVFAIMLIIESLDGIIQFFDNQMIAGDDEAWSIVLAIVAVAISMCLHKYLLSLVRYKAGAEKRMALLKRTRRFIRRYGRKSLLEAIRR